MKNHVNEITPLLHDMLADAVNQVGREVGVEKFRWVMHPNTMSHIVWHNAWNGQKILGIGVEANTHVPFGQIECRYVVGSVSIPLD